MSVVKSLYRSSDRAVLDRHGQIIDEIRVEKNVRRLNWVGLDHVTPAFVEALLKAEDKRFYYHPGVDFLALSKATIARLFGRTERGASTITMQLTELLEDPTGEVSLAGGYAKKLAKSRRRSRSKRRGPSTTYSKPT